MVEHMIPNPFFDLLQIGHSPSKCCAMDGQQSRKPVALMTPKIGVDALIRVDAKE
jgi:hypothetical protein